MTVYPSSSPPRGPFSDAERIRRQKRRRQNASDDDIEDAMDMRLPYRIGWGGFGGRLPPLPVSTRTQGARNQVSNSEYMLDHVESLCRADGLEVGQIFFAYRFPQGAEPTAYHTLVITTNMFSPSSDKVHAISKIRKALLNFDTTEDTYIELIDQRVLNGLSTFPIKHTEVSLLNVWEKAHKLAITAVNKAGQRWLAMELLHRGLEHKIEKCPATLVITSPTASNDIWTTRVIPTIQSDFNRFGIPLQIELLHGISLRAANEHVPRSQIYDWSYEKEVVMGASIGSRTASEKASATIGGVIKFANKASCALTNHHVIRNDDLDKLLKSANGNLPLKPLHPKITQSPQYFDSPSTQDHEMYIVWCQGEEEAWASAKTADFSSKQQQAKRAKKAKAQAEKTNRGFGELLASSGLRTMECDKFPTDKVTGKFRGSVGNSLRRFMLDWCLINTRGGRTMTNKLPTVRIVEEDTNVPIFRSAKVCQRWTSLDNGRCNIKAEDVAIGMYGRTSHWKFGQVHPVPVIINPVVHYGDSENISTPYDLTEEAPGHCFSVSNSSTHETTPFIKPGDSGSLILHAPTGVWLGLIFGVSRTGQGLMIPIDVVLEDIKNVVGIDIIEPTFERHP